MKTINKKQLLVTTLLSGAAFGMMAAPSFAQDAADDEIVVTGSRIAQKDFTSNSPVATVDAAQFETTFSINTENLLNTLPQTVPGLDRTSNNPGNGSATVDLRGLGANRTLVLVNGTRMVPFGQNGVVDLNSIPTSLIKNVEVLTGGASSVYGADAVAGVVNFILKDDFEGIESNIGYSMTEKGDAGLLNVDVTMGANLDNGRGNVVMNASYANREALFQGDRDFANVALFDDGAGGLEPGGSSGVPGTSIFSGGASNPAAERYVFPDGTTGTVGIFESSGDFRPFVLGGQVNDFYNYAPVNFIQLPQERFTITALGNYEINDHIEAYGRLSFAQNRVESELAPTPIFQNSTFSLDNNPFITAASQVTLSGNNTDQLGIGDRVGRVFSDGGSFFTDTNTCTNCVFDSTFIDNDGDGVDDDARLDTAPIIDTDGDGIADTASALVRRRLVEVGPREADDINDAFQITMGLRGDLTDRWSYDVFLQEGRTVRAQTQKGNVNRGRFNQALLLADADGDGNVDLDASGNPSCSDPSQNGGTPGGCVPLNIFGAGNISEGAAGFISTAAAATAEFQQTVLQGNLVGDLGELGWTEDPIGIAVGAEYIETEADFRPSQDVAVSTIAGFNGSPPSGGKYDVWSVYGELQVPIIADVPFAQRITLDLSGRYSDYSTSGGSEAYKIGGEWAINEQLRFRGNYNRAVRAPNIGELFQPIGEGFPGAVDPCSAAALASGPITDATRAICVATGVPAGSVGSAAINTISGQVRTLAGGNPNLDVETADTYTIGAVFTPNFLEGFSASIDYYDITINDAIAAFGGGANNVLSVCYTGAAGGVGSDFCNVVNRRPDGSIQAISLQARNVASTETAGIDLAAKYGFDLADIGLSDKGSIDLNYLGTYNLKNDFTAFLGDNVIECAGEFGTTCGEPDPTYRHRFTSRWNYNNVSVQGVWRLVGTVDDDAGPGVRTVDSISTEHYFDVSTSWDINDHFALTLGVNNVIDNNAPVIGDNDEQANTYPATYDVYGRTFFANLKTRF